MSVIILIGLGALAGTLSGMGLGGGLVLIPALTMLMGVSQHGAQGVNLAYFIPTAIFAVFVHKKSGNIERAGLFSMILGGVFGAIAGSLLAMAMQGTSLRMIFAGFLMIMGLYEFFRKTSETS